MWTQAVQLLVCDWLLTTRTEVWQRDCAALARGDNTNDEEAVTTTTMFADDLTSFQQDLASLRRLARHWSEAMTKVSATSLHIIIIIIHAFTMHTSSVMMLNQRRWQSVGGQHW